MKLIPSLIVLLTLSWSGVNHAALPSCQQIARDIAQQKHVPAKELQDILVSLNQNNRLPDQFVTKKTAQQAGWKPGSSLWDSLPGKSIGGDKFSNRERRLPDGKYFEADLDYQGYKRNAKRIVFQVKGPRYITVDHYNTFTEISACQ
ncbi:ribonuclease [Chitinibacter bivalviorum]|uniref:Ribonuclease n=1 Tax=Chitinibacter bivalviorum TaxID=2739434 RepID=A0A7H9BFS6_9NEIS|nr:ribonuclease domain-containing protein [Chitinibacter bivalviorum]QLG87425.1 ribonuclease [Chitinibacter bivalviorum]